MSRADYIGGASLISESLESRCATDARETGADIAMLRIARPNAMRRLDGALKMGCAGSLTISGSLRGRPRQALGPRIWRPVGRASRKPDPAPNDDSDLCADVRWQGRHIDVLNDAGDRRQFVGGDQPRYLLEAVPFIGPSYSTPAPQPPSSWRFSVEFDHICPDAIGFRQVELEPEPTERGVHSSNSHPSRVEPGLPGVRARIARRAGQARPNRASTLRFVQPAPRARGYPRGVVGVLRDSRRMSTS